MKPRWLQETFSAILTELRRLREFAADFQHSIRKKPQIGCVFPEFGASVVEFDRENQLGMSIHRRSEYDLSTASATA